MEIIYSGDALSFEWDSNKADANLVKHKVSFFEASEACEDPYARDATEDDRDYGEDRQRIIGYSTKSRLLLVVYVERRERIRIISAREANKAETRLYEQ